MHIDASHIREIRSRENVFLVEEAIIKKFSLWLNSLPWCATSLDWRQIPGYVRANIPGGGEVWEGKVLEWANRLPIAKCSHIVPFYSREQPSVAVPFHYGITNLDLLFATYPNKGYVFGVDSTNEYDYRFGTLFEWDQRDTFRGSVDLIEW